MRHWGKRCITCGGSESLIYLGKPHPTGKEYACKHHIRDYFGFNNLTDEDVEILSLDAFTKD